jgi:uncharacterized protein (DUF433 family)
MSRFRRITFDRRIMGGRACIRGMRITVSVILKRIANGATHEEILADYPDLQPQDIRQVLSYATSLLYDGSPPLPPAGIRSINERLSNREIAQQIDLKRGWITCRRKLPGTPPVARSRPISAYVNFARKHKTILNGAPYALLRELMPAPQKGLHKPLKLAGIKPAPGDTRRGVWQYLVDWRLPNVYLAAIWDRYSSHIAVVRRLNGGRAAAWDMTNRAARQDRRLDKIVRQQEEVANTYRTLGRQKRWLAIARLIHTYRQQHPPVVP